MAPIGGMNLRWPRRKATRCKAHSHASSTAVVPACHDGRPYAARASPSCPGPTPPSHLSARLTQLPSPPSARTNERAIRQRSRTRFECNRQARGRLSHEQKRQADHRGRDRPCAEWRHAVHAPSGYLTRQIVPSVPVAPCTTRLVLTPSEHLVRNAQALASAPSGAERASSRVH